MICELQCQQNFSSTDHAIDNSQFSLLYQLMITKLIYDKLGYAKHMVY